MPIDVFLLGDSHIGAYKAGAEALDIRAGGGITIPHLYIHHDGLRFDATKGFAFRDVPDFPNKKPIALFEQEFQKLLDKAGAASLADVHVPVITDIGCNPTVIARYLTGYSFDPASQKKYISKGLIKDIIMDNMANQIEIARWLQSRMPKVCFVFPPIAANASREIWLYCEQVLIDLYKGFGAETYSPVSWACTKDRNGGLLPEYAIMRNGLPDLVHGNRQFGARAMEECMRLLGFAPATSGLEGSAAAEP
jgi:hypothetical protein